MRCRPHGPAEVCFVKATNAQPDAVFIPAQHFDTRVGFIGEDEGGSFTPRRVELILDILRYRVDPPPHINGFDVEKDIFRRQHI